MGQATSFHELPAVVFPLHIEVWGPGEDRLGKPSWQSVVKSPGDLRVPKFEPGSWAKLTLNDNAVVWRGPEQKSFSSRDTRQRCWHPPCSHFGDPGFGNDSCPRWHGRRGANSRV